MKHKRVHQEVQVQRALEKRLMILGKEGNLWFAGVGFILEKAYSPEELRRALQTKSEFVGICLVIDAVTTR
jgi:hypothetical protein